MRKILRVLLVIFISLASVIIVLIAGIYIFFPKVAPAPDIKVVSTTTRVKRGEYLFYSAAGCVSCHSQRDEAKLTMPIIPGTEGSGGEKFDHRLGFPGSFVAKNLTPSHLGDWTDGEIYRAVVSGVSKDGRALFPIMPYENYARMGTEDIYSVISFLRTLHPVNTSWPDSHFDFPMNIIVRTIPKNVQPQGIPDTANTIAYGKYLVNIASCMTCHTQAKQGKIIESLAFGGGREMPVPTGGVVRSANITPDVQTGIGTWTRTDFVARFKTYQDSGFIPKAVEKNQFNTIMPWTLFAKLKTSDLEAIYEYLRTIKPINNKVIKFSRAK